MQNAEKALLFAIKDAASSKQHDEDCERILVELSCFWKPRLEGPNDIINLNYFPIDKCMTYDKYTEMQESMHGKEAMYGIFTENEEQIAGRSRSVNDLSDGSKDVHISIKGLAILQKLTLCCPQQAKAICMRTIMIQKAKTQ